MRVRKNTFKKCSPRTVHSPEGPALFCSSQEGASALQQMCALLLSVHYVDPKTSLERSRTFCKGTVVVSVFAQCHPQYVLELRLSV